MARTEIPVVMRSAKNSYSARGIFDGKGVTVLKGSRVSANVTTTKGDVKGLRARYVDENNILQTDLWFKSPSSASDFVSGRSANGWREWETEDGTKISVFRDLGEGQVEPPAPKPQPKPVPADDTSAVRRYKDAVEAILHNLTAQDSDARVESMERHTALYYRGVLVASVYYRVGAIRIEMRDVPAVHTLYDELRAEAVTYQRPSANPYATAGRYAFFVNAGDEETALLAILIAAQDGSFDIKPAPASPKPQKKPPVVEPVKIPHVDRKAPVLPASTAPKSASEILQTSILTTPIAAQAATAAGSVSQVEARLTEDKLNPAAETEGKSNGTATVVPPPAMQPPVGLAAAGRTAQPVYPERPQAPVRAPEISSRLEKKLDSIIGAIATMYSEKSSATETAAPAPTEIDPRFRIEVTQGNAPVLMLKTRPAITGLIFTLKLCAVGLESSAERYQVFFASKNAESMSEPQDINAIAGEEYSCRFELKSSASEEKAVYLAVRSVNAAPDEVRQLIEIPVKIAFAADFGV